LKNREEYWREKRRKIESSKRDPGKKSKKIVGKQNEVPPSGSKDIKRKKMPVKSMKTKKPKEPMTPKEPVDMEVSK
jgi:hypothetical protein